MQIENIHNKDCKQLLQVNAKLYYGSETSVLNLCTQRKNFNYKKLPSHGCKTKKKLKFIERNNFFKNFTFKMEKDNLIEL